MIIKLELFGASRDFSDKDHLDLEIQDKASVGDLRNVIIKYLDKNFDENVNFKTKQASINIKKPEMNKPNNFFLSKIIL